MYTTELQGIGTPSSIHITRPNGRSSTLPIHGTQEVGDVRTSYLRTLEDMYEADPHGEVWPLQFTKG